MSWEKEPIKVNKILGKQAGFGPIPANQILPWFAIITITYFIFDGLLSWGIPTGQTHLNLKGAGAAPAALSTVGAIAL